MSTEYVVEWHELLPFDDVEWRSGLQLAVSMLRGDSPVRFRSAADETSDLTVVAYMAGDHDRIVQGETLAAFLRSRPDLASTTVLVVACAQRRPALRVAEVRELLITQGAGLRSPRHLRSTIPDALTRDCRLALIQCLEERDLMELPPSPFEESATVRPPLVNPRRRRFESI